MTRPQLRKPRDTLLAAAKFLTMLLTGLTIFAMAMVGLATGAVLTVQRAEILEKLARAGEGSLAFWVLIIVLLAIFAVLWLGYHFFARLYELIRSVDQGDPFRPENAVLLERMGWISAIAQLVLLAVTLPAKWMVAIAKEVGDKVTFDSGIGIGSLLLTLVLFVLARVFRHGAEMRQDLEGTV